MAWPIIASILGNLISSNQQEEGKSGAAGSAIGRIGGSSFGGASQNMSQPVQENFDWSQIVNQLPKQKKPGWLDYTMSFIGRPLPEAGPDYQTQFKINALLQQQRAQDQMNYLTQQDKLRRAADAEQIKLGAESEAELANKKMWRDLEALKQGTAFKKTELDAASQDRIRGILGSPQGQAVVEEFLGGDALEFEGQRLDDPAVAEAAANYADMVQKQQMATELEQKQQKAKVDAAYDISRLTLPVNQAVFNRNTGGYDLVTQGSPEESMILPDGKTIKMKAAVQPGIKQLFTADENRAQAEEAMRAQEQFDEIQGMLDLINQKDQAGAQNAPPTLATSSDLTGLRQSAKAAASPRSLYSLSLDLNRGFPVQFPPSAPKINEAIQQPPINIPATAQPGIGNIPSVSQRFNLYDNLQLSDQLSPQVDVENTRNLSEKAKKSPFKQKQDQTKKDYDKSKEELSRQLDAILRYFKRQ